MKLKESNLWWHGPQWLTNESIFPNIKPFMQIDNLPEINKTRVTVNLAITTNPLFERYSNLHKLVRITIHIARFINNIRKCKLTGPITQTECDSALFLLLKLCQRETFPLELNSINERKPLNKQSKILSLSPFIDDSGILRVGGRLNNSNLDYNQKHPIILPSKHPLTKLLIHQTHIDNLHCGQQQVLYTLRQKYWPINAKSVIRKIIHQCIRCHKVNPKPYEHQMGNLPKSRLTPSPPFFYCGIDYAGPFFTRDKRARGYTKSKAYICLFLCFNTKAVHLELVSSLTTEAFLESLRRFIARRGQPNTIYTDNGTNFVGAYKELQRLQTLAKDPQIAKSLMNEDKTIILALYSTKSTALWRSMGGTR